MEWGEKTRAGRPCLFRAGWSATTTSSGGSLPADVKKVSHNVKDLIHALLAEGLSPEGFVFDTALAAYLLAPTDGSYDLEKLAGDLFQF